MLCPIWLKYENLGCLSLYTIKAYFNLKQSRLHVSYNSTDNDFSSHHNKLLHNLLSIRFVIVFLFIRKTKSQKVT